MPNLRHQRTASMTTENWWWASVLLLVFIFFLPCSLMCRLWLVLLWVGDMQTWVILDCKSFFSYYLIPISGSIKPINFCHERTPSWDDESLVIRCIIKANILQFELRVGLYITDANMGIWSFHKYIMFLLFYTPVWLTLPVHLTLFSHLSFLSLMLLSQHSGGYSIQAEERRLLLLCFVFLEAKGRSKYKNKSNWLK